MGLLERLFLAAALVLGAVPVYAFTPEIRDIEVNVRLGQDGAALITEKWDVTVDGITEWYLVRTGLGSSEIRDFVVFDENGRHTVKYDGQRYDCYYHDGEYSAVFLFGRESHKTSENS